MAPYTAGSPVSSRHCRCPSVSAGPPQGGKFAALGQSSPSSVLTVAVQNRGRREDLPSREHTETRTSLHTYVPHTIVHTTRHTDIQTHAHTHTHPHTVTVHECEWHTTQVRTTLLCPPPLTVSWSFMSLLLCGESLLVAAERVGLPLAGWRGSETSLAVETSLTVAMESTLESSIWFSLQRQHKTLQCSEPHF